MTNPTKNPSRKKRSGDTIKVLEKLAENDKLITSRSFPLCTHDQSFNWKINTIGIFHDTHLSKQLLFLLSLFHLSPLVHMAEMEKRNFFEWKMFGVWIKHDMNCKCSKHQERLSFPPCSLTAFMVYLFKRSASVSSFFLLFFMFYICNQAREDFSLFNDKNMLFSSYLLF